MRTHCGFLPITSDELFHELGLEEYRKYTDDIYKAKAMQTTGTNSQMDVTEDMRNIAKAEIYKLMYGG